MWMMRKNSYNMLITCIQPTSEAVAVGGGMLLGVGFEVVTPIQKWENGDACHLV